MLPALVNIEFTQGEDIAVTLYRKRRPAPGATAVPVDMSGPGWAARAQLRLHGSLLLTFDTNTATTPDGTIELGADGAIVLTAPAAAVTAHGKADWSLLLDDPDLGRRFVFAQGIATIFAPTTLPAP